MARALLAAVIEGAIPLFGGIFLTLIAYRVIGNTPKLDDWHARYGRIARATGPVVVIIGLFGIAFAIVRAYSDSSSMHATRWSRYYTSDGVCSAEFMGDPQAKSETVEGLQSKSLQLLLKNRDMALAIGYTAMPASFSPELADDQFFDAVKEDFISVNSRRGKAEVVRSEAVVVNDVSGRLWELAIAEGGACELRAFVVREKLYKVAAFWRRSKENDDDAERFRKSFRFEKNAARN